MTTRRPALQQHDRWTTMAYLFHWIMDAIVAIILPVRLGMLGAPLWLFPAYAVVAGCMLTIAEDVRYLREVFTRRDIRDYLRVRIVLILVSGILPFVFGRCLIG